MGTATAVVHNISSWKAVGVSLGILAITAFTTDVVQRNISELYYEIYPAAYDFNPSSVTTEGTNGVIVGTITRRHSCQYKYPPIARDIRTGSLLSVESRSNNQTISFSPSDTAYSIGPWIIQNAKGKRVEITLHHTCDGFDVFSKLGVVEFK